MREVTLSTGEVIKIHPLTAKDVREIADLDDKKSWEETFETVWRAGFAKEKVDKMMLPDVLKLARAITAETIGTPEEIKN